MIACCKQMIVQFLLFYTVGADANDKSLMS